MRETSVNAWICNSNHGTKLIIPIHVFEHIMFSISIYRIISDGYPQRGTQLLRMSTKCMWYCDYLTY